MTDDEQQIRALVARWHQASSAGDIAAVLALMTDDVVFLTPGHAPMDKAGFAAQSAPAGGQRPTAIKSDQTIREIQVSGDMAFMWTELAVSVTPPGAAQPMVKSGHTLSIFRKAGGHWKLARDANLLSPKT
jgi:uncharacterized protein (TIGR02246 family)